MQVGSPSVGSKPRTTCTDSGLLRSAGDVWACVLEVNWWRRRRAAPPLAGYQGLCRELSAAGPGTFGELDSVGARSVLRRFSDAWFSAAKRRKAGDVGVGFPRRRRRLTPVRWYHGTFTLDGHRVRLPTAAGCPPLRLRLDRDIPYPVEQVRSLTLLYEGGRLCLEVTAEVPVAAYPDREGPDPGRIAGVDLGIIHPYAVAGRKGRRCWCPGGRSAPSTASTCPTPNSAAGPPPGGPRNPDSAGRGGGGKPEPGPAGGGPAPASGPASPTRSRPHRG
jgi:hypothetical protein